MNDELHEAASKSLNHRYSSHYKSNEDLDRDIKEEERSEALIAAIDRNTEVLNQIAKALKDLADATKDSAASESVRDYLDREYQFSKDL